MRTHTFSNIERFFFRLYGKPSFGIETENADGSFRIHLWYYLPPSKQPEENTVIYTVGLSQKYFESACPWIELSFHVPGQHGRTQLEKLGMILGEFIYDTFKVTNFTPNLLLTGLKHHFMPDMRNIMVGEGAGMRPLWLELEDRTVRVLHLIPVYSEELPHIREMGFWNTYRTFMEHKINFLAPNRTKLSKAQFHTDDQRLAREVEIYKGLPPREKIWTDVQKWYKANAPKIPAAQFEQPPAHSDHWEKIFGLNNSSGQKIPEVKTDEWIEQHWERLYAGGFLPTQEKVLPINSHFIS